MQRYWFKQKRYGFGAAPSGWEGWALIAVYVATLGVIAYVTGAPIDAAFPNQPLSFIVLTVAITIIFVGIVWRTTEGGWRWRWGKD